MRVAAAAEVGSWVVVLVLVVVTMGGVGRGGTIELVVEEVVEEVEEGVVVVMPMGCVMSVERESSITLPELPKYFWY